MRGSGYDQGGRAQSSKGSPMKETMRLRVVPEPRGNPEKRSPGSVGSCGFRTFSLATPKWMPWADAWRNLRELAIDAKEAVG